MFEFISRAFAAGARISRPTADARAPRCRLKFECLESRCLLFAAPTSFEYFLDLHTLPVSEPESIPAPTHVSLELRLGSVIRPAMPDPAYLLPLPSPSEGYWPQLPSDGLPNPVPPTSPWIPGAPDGDLSLGGFSDIDDLDSGGQATFSGGELSKEVRQVLEVLAALQYVPDVRQEISDDLLATLAADLASVAPIAVSNESEHTLRSPGGMIELVRETLIEDRTRSRKSAEWDSLPVDVSVTMDVAYGRFQAFEVSTREPLPPPPAPPVNDESSSLPNSPGVLTPSSLPGGELPPGVPPEATGAALDSHAPEQLNESDVSPAPVLDASWETTNRVLGVTAAAALVAYAAHNNPAASTRESDKRQTMLSSLHAICRWPVNQAARLIKALTRQSAL